MSTVPATAETLDLTQFLISIPHPSKYLPGLIAISPIFACPSCKKHQPVPPIGKNFTCDCGLSMHLEISRIQVWRDREPAFHD